MATILLVNDEKIVRTLMAVALRRQGHTVIEASSAHRAIAASRRLNVPPGLLLSELSLPEMSALELADRLTEESPGTPVLLLSRSPHPEQLEKRAATSGYTVLREPLDFSSLAGAVAGLLDEPQTRKPPSISGAPRSRPGVKTGNR